MSFVLLMGFVSLLSDMTHEGAASINGAFLSLLGASAEAIGFMSGLGVLIGYGLRLLTGYIADKTHKLWIMTIVGYAVDLLLIPFLALVPENGWIAACAILLVGKIGNAVKKPAKDAMISYAASEKGEGKSFAILEFVDQIGAFLGPMVLFFVMLLTTDLGEYRQYGICFAVLAVPALACIALLLFAKRTYPNPADFEKEKEKTRFGAKRTFILYLIAAGIFAFGFIDFSIITAHESAGTLIPTDYLPLIYAAAMLIDAFSALFFGWLFDRLGFWSLIIAAAVSAPFALFVFGFDSMWSLIVGVIMWGVSMGAQESIMKAAVATMTSKNSRAKSYGIFQLFFGVFWFFGSWLTGWLYDRSIRAMIITSVSVEALAVVFFLFTQLSIAKDKRAAISGDYH